MPVLTFPDRYYCLSRQDNTDSGNVRWGATATGKEQQEPMSRSQEFDRATVMEKAMERFWKNGYEATSMAELLAATGLSRSSLYAEFGSKLGIFNLVYDQYRARRTQHLNEILARYPAPEGIRRFFGEIAQAAAGDPASFGCMSTNQAVELARVDETVRQKVRSDYAQLEERLYEYLLEGQVNGTVPASADVAAATSALVTAFSGFQLAVRGGLDRSRLTRTLDYLMHPLDGTKTVPVAT